MTESDPPGWRFIATDPRGKVVTGTVPADSEDDAIAAVRARQLRPRSVEPVRPVRSFRIRRRVHPAALSSFTRQFATLIDAALPLLGGLEMLLDITDDRTLAAILRKVTMDVRGGASLSEALSSHPETFTPIYVHMVRAGEVSGTLPESLNRVADYMEDSQALRDRVVGAMIYPVVVLATALAAVCVILVFVVPIFAGLFTAEGLALPLSTRVLLSASTGLSTYWPLLLLGVSAAVALGHRIWTSARGRRAADAVIIRVPVIGSLARKASVARATRAMASLVHSGVTLSDTLFASAKVAGNREIETAFLTARDAIHAGSDLATPLGRSPVLPRLLPQMVRVGEESGRLEQMLDKVADVFEAEVKTAIDGAMKALEPALIVLLGVALGGLVAAMYLPIFDLMTSLG